jgi:hypothetical protein
LMSFAPERKCAAKRSGFFAPRRINQFRLAEPVHNRFAGHLLRDRLGRDRARPHPQVFSHERTPQLVGIAE